MLLQQHPSPICYHPTARAAMGSQELDRALDGDDAIEEEVAPLPLGEIEKDPYFGERVKVLDFFGVVEGVGRGLTSGELLYFIRYADGDIEHLGVAQITEAVCGD
jgi:hypothetical protein